MLRGYRLFFAALIGWLALSAQHPNPKAETQRGSPQERSASALEGIAARYDKQAEGAERSPESNPCQPGDDQRNSDLCAQWKAADAAADSAWWAAIGGFASAISTVLVLIALYLAFRSNGIARDTAKRQLRAYVAVSGYVIGPDDKQPHKIRVVVSYQNVGETPAIDVRVTLFVLAGDGPFSDAKPRHEPDLGAGGRAIIGKGVIKQTPMTVEVFGVAPRILLDGDYWVCFYGRINYRDVFGVEQETRYCAYVDAPTRAVGMVYADAPGGNSMT